MRAVSRRAEGGGRRRAKNGQLVLGLGLAELAICAGAGAAAARLWRQAEGDPGLAFWLLAALALCCGGQALANLGVLAIERLAGRRAPRSLAVLIDPALGRPLPSSWAGFFGGLGFLAAAAPLTYIIARDADWDTPWGPPVAGAALAGMLLGVIMLAVAARGVYLLIIGGMTELEAERRELRRGASMRLLLRHHPGRRAPEQIAVRLVCTRTAEERVLPPGRGKVQQTRELFAQELVRDGAPPAGLWERPVTLKVPLEGPTSADGRVMIAWAVEVRLSYRGLPDVCEQFFLEVV